jgi:hypothetical protein
MTTPVMTKTVATKPGTRTLTRDRWNNSLNKTVLLPKEISGVVRDCMASLIQPFPVNPSEIALRPWFVGERINVYGTMWAGVPHVRSSWQEEDGSWMISCNVGYGEEHTCYLRLSPAIVGDEVQYGMCEIRIDKFSALSHNLLGPRDGWEIKSMAVSTPHGSSFRVDKIIASAIRLSSLEDQSEAGKEFKTLLDGTSLHVFVDSLTSKCYSDSTRAKDILIDKDPPYKRMVRLVALHAYPKLFSPHPDTGLEAFNLALGLSSGDSWDTSVIWPTVYNVIMPREIFDRVSHSLEKGIPPLVPMYVTNDLWMFNGKWNRPCSGLILSDSVGVDSYGKKILSGVLNSFNLDLAGLTSFWDPEHKCPGQEWVDTFLRVADDLLSHKMGWDTNYKQDMSLLCSRKIPILFDTYCRGNHLARYTILRSVGINKDGYITGIETCECDSTGKALESKSPKPPGEEKKDHSDLRVCSGCWEEHPIDVFATCNACGHDTCNDCRQCCSGCDEELCGTCFRGVQSHSCIACSVCDDMVDPNSCYTCSSCGDLTCQECSGYECDDCGGVDLCYSCHDISSSHDCPGRRGD